MQGRSIASAFFRTGSRLAARAATVVMKDPRGQEVVARAVGLAQRGRQRVEEVQGRVMRAAGIPDRQDYQDLAKQLARIKRKARELAARLDATRPPAPRKPDDDAR